jgi:hypothetical protein
MLGRFKDQLLKNGAVAWADAMPLEMIPHSGQVI